MDADKSNPFDDRSYKVKGGITLLDR